ncbi:secreted RxLR effector protein 161-like [Lucilia sericata]|uniref:secreted RxLR effector protein 161-like n=1 Tax=Lucilia sericata TaxID=13632 RepID=UPI0018A86A72|nr:secreted RxLR effector protein 161-like [Lucilia sericata]
MQDAKPMSTPAEYVQTTSDASNKVKFPYREAVGSLMYLAIATRPDIAFAVSYASRFMDSYNEEHIAVIKRIFKYLIGTIDEGIIFAKTDDLFLNCYSDSDYAGDTETRHSTSGYVLMLSGGTISWSSRKQQTIALSTTEAEYIAACESVKELIWVQRLLNDLLGDDVQVPVLNLDNQSAIKLVKTHNFTKELSTLK